MNDYTRRAVTLLALLCFVIVPTGCGKKTVESPVAAAGSTFRGAKFLRGTVGSYAGFNNTEPQLVSGYGLMVGLRGTGSAEVPAFLREWLIREMRQQGVGSIRYRDVMPGTPEQVLARSSTAVVEIVGLRPPAAVSSTRFDVLVRPADSQTTSLRHGTLWSAQLSPGPLDDPNRFRAPVAVARGSVYLDPLDAGDDASSPSPLATRDEQFDRFGVIAGGGVSTEPRKVELVLNQPSWRVARLISDRINERFPLEPTAKFQTAVPRSSLLVEVNLPKRFESDPGRFLNLVQYLFTQKSPNFTIQQGRELITLLSDPEHRRDHLEATTFALQGLGPNVIPVLRDYYGPSIELPVRMAALKSAALLGDEQAAAPLVTLAGHRDPAIRAAAATALVDLPRTASVWEALRLALEDADTDVRIATYEAMSRVDDSMINRLVMREPSTREIKYVIDRIPTDRPLLYITHQRVPRIVIFNPSMPFNDFRLGTVWDSQLMLRLVSQTVEINAASQPATQPEAFRYLDLRYQTTPTRSIRLKVAPDVPTLAYVLGHVPTPQDPTDGLRLSFGEVVDALHTLQQQGVIEAPIRIKSSDLASAIRDASGRDQPLERSAGGPAIQSADESATTQDPEMVLPPDDAGVLTLPD